VRSTRSWIISLRDCHANGLGAADVWRSMLPTISTCMRRLSLLLVDLITAQPSGRSAAQPSDNFGDAQFIQLQVRSHSLKYLLRTQVNTMTHTQPGIRRSAPLATPHTNMHSITLLVTQSRAYFFLGLNDPRNHASDFPTFLPYTE
jgi:hypothetical protein